MCFCRGGEAEPEELATFPISAVKEQFFPLEPSTLSSLQEQMLRTLLVLVHSRGRDALRRKDGVQVLGWDQGLPIMVSVWVGGISGLGLYTPVFQSQGTDGS